MMTSLKFPTVVLLSISSGRLLCPFSEMHECVEFLVGNPVWTHQFADRRFAKELADAVIGQYPQLSDFDANAVTKENWRAMADAAITKYGETLALHPMGEPEHYEGAFTRPLKGKKVIAVKTR